MALAGREDHQINGEQHFRASPYKELRRQRFPRTAFSRSSLPPQSSHAALTLSFQQIPNFGEELDLRCRLGFRGLLLLKFIHSFDDQEQHACYDEKVQSDGQKLTPAEHSSFLFGVSICDAFLNLGG